MNRVPICSKYCDDWFEACKDDMTCAQDWLNGFNFTSNVYSCPTSSTCRTFSEVTLVKYDLVLFVLLSTAMCVIIEVKMLWTQEARCLPQHQRQRKCF